MIIDHTHPLYVKKRNSMTKDGKYNGAYYYSREIVKNIIPRVKTDRNWVTIRLPEMKVHPDHSIIFIHNNRNPNYYSYLKDYKDCNDYLRSIDSFNYDSLSIWALEKYNHWISKDKKHIISTTVGTIPPRDNREKAINSLTNFKITLEKIEIIKCIKFN